MHAIISQWLKPCLILKPAADFFDFFCLHTDTIFMHILYREKLIYVTKFSRINHIILETNGGNIWCIKNIKRKGFSAKMGSFKMTELFYWPIYS
jgi:hypothetical protein